MQPTQEKIQVSQNDYNNLADWAKPSYSVSSIPTPQTNINTKPSSTGVSMTVDSLQSTPLVKLPKQTVQDTTATGIIASTQPSVAMAQDQYNQVKQATGTEAQDAQKALQDMAFNIFGQKADAQANQVNLENQQGLLEQQKVLGEINTEMAREQVGLRNEQERIRQGYGTEAQKAISQNTLNETYGRRLADLAIRQSAANQNVTAIRENAERQTRLLTAPLDTKIQYLSTFAKDNVDFLNNEQKTKLAFITNNLESQKQDIQALQNAKTQMIMEIANNGGGSKQELIRDIQNATDIGSVASIGANSGYIGKLDRTLKQAQISKIYQDMAEAKVKSMGLSQMKPEDYSRFQSDPNVKALSASEKYLAQLKSYKDAIKQYGSGEVINSAGAGALSAAYTDLVTSYKDFKNLGTWDAGSAALISMGIDEPSVFSRDSRVLSALDKLENNAIGEMKSANNTIMSSPYSQTYEGRVLIEKNNNILNAKQVEKSTNKELLDSIPSNSNSTTIINNETFFNR